MPNHISHRLSRSPSRENDFAFTASISGSGEEKQPAPAASASKQVDPKTNDNAREYRAQQDREAQQKLLASAPSLFESDTKYQAESVINSQRPLEASQSSLRELSSKEWNEAIRVMLENLPETWPNNDRLTDTKHMLWSMEDVVDQNDPTTASNNKKLGYFNKEGIPLGLIKMRGIPEGIQLDDIVTHPGSRVGCFLIEGAVKELKSNNSQGLLFLRSLNDSATKAYNAWGFVGEKNMALDPDPSVNEKWDEVNGEWRLKN